MKLLTAKLKARIPALYATEHQEDPTVQCKFFDPCSNWTWFLLEFDGEDTCFGLVVGFDTELGYFSLSELETTRNRYGLTMERDLYFDPCPLSKIKRKLNLPE